MKDALAQETLRALALVTAAFWLTTGSMVAKHYWGKVYSLATENE